MIIWFTTYIYLLCNGDDKLVNRCSREHATITSCCNFKGIYLRKKKWYKMKTPQFGQKRQAPEARLQGLATKRVFRESRKEVCRDMSWQLGNPTEELRMARAPSQKGITNQRRNRKCQTVVATWYSLVSICSACQTTSEIAKSEKDRAICFSLGHLCSWANLGPEWHIGAYGYDIKHVHGTLDHLLSENWRGKMVFCSQAAAMKLIAKGWGKRFSSRKW